jgi:hypothetical protein
VEVAEAEAGSVEVAAADEEEAVGARATEVMEAVASAFCFLVTWAGGFIRGAGLFPEGSSPVAEGSSRRHRAIGAPDHP